MAVKTPRDALELVRDRGLITEVPAEGAFSLAEAVLGGPVEGGWWAHHRGGRLFRLGHGLRASEEVAAVRLVEGKLTFVHQALWPPLYRVVMDPERRRRSLVGLSDEARALLGEAERYGRVWGDAPAATDKAREALEERLLVQVGEAEREGRHLPVVRSWRAWAGPGLREASAGLEYGASLEALRRAAGGAPGGLGPWVY